MKNIILTIVAACAIIFTANDGLAKRRCCSYNRQTTYYSQPVVYKVVQPVKVKTAECKCDPCLCENCTCGKTTPVATTLKAVKKVVTAPVKAVQKAKENKPLLFKPVIVQPVQQNTGSSCPNCKITR